MVLEETRLPHGVMEGKGSYNKHAKLPARGAAWATPFLVEAVEKATLEPEDEPVIVADYGSSQGENTLAPMGIAIQNLRPRVRPDRPIFVFHVDQPSNDFNSLFEVLGSHPDRYALNEANVFPCAIGRSFYEQVLPTHSVHLGWSSYAAVWLRRIPSLIPGHFFPLFATGEVRAAFERQAAEDWEAFLSLRAREMRPGARLVVVLPAVSDDGLAGFAKVIDHANDVLAEMAAEGAITAQERTRMVLGSYPRRKSELLAPFTKDNQFRGLMVEDCEMSLLADPTWGDYQLDGDKAALASKQALFFRAIFTPSLGSALTRVQAGDAETLRIFADCLQEGLTQRLAEQPAPADTFVQTIVLAKCG